MVTEAFLKGDSVQCGLDAVKKSNEEWKFWIVMIIVLNIIGFIAVIFVPCKIYEHIEMSYLVVVDSNRFKLDYMETLIKRVETQIERVKDKVGMWKEDEDLEERFDILQDYVRRIHSGLILNGGFVERERERNTKYTNHSQL